MLKNIKDSIEIAYKQELESDDNIYIKGQIKDWEEMLSNIKHEQELKDNALKMYDEGQKEIERLNNIINELEKSWKEEITRLANFIQEDVSLIEINNIRQMLIQERQKDLYKLQELKGSDK